MTTEFPVPIAYFITFTCYGTRLHGDERGSVDMRHRVYGSDFLLPNPDWVRRDGQALAQAPYEMDAARRSLVLDAIVAVAKHREWKLKAVHVRSNHVHVVAGAREEPERVMNDFKAYAPRALNAAGMDSRDRKRWTRDGSTIYLWEPEQVETAIGYVLDRQGEPMAVWP